MMYVWKAIEDAGYSAESLSGTDTALFVGMANNGYSERVLRAVESYSYTSLLTSVGPNRMSYFLNLHGPSEPIETASSSSLVAIHRGVNAIENGQCAMAIVGGVNTLVSPEAHISFSKAGILCEDGRCKPFSAEANGYVRGEGVGMLVLKKLSDAEQAGDHIYGVIRATAENHGGRSSSLTAPNPRAQADLLIAAYRKAGIDPRTVGYIEAHGTGTPLGDPIEINALKTAFRELVGVAPGADLVPGADSCGEKSTSQAWCGIGSLKSNIGHLELASGVTGVIKVLLQLQHKKLVKTLHCEQINPYIQLESSPFYIVQENREWEAQRDRMGNALPRRAGVSSFGFGGVNAHVVLEEYVPKSRATLPESLTQLPSSGQTSGWGQAPPLLIVLSARNEERLQEQVRQLLAWVQGESQMGATPIPTAPGQKLQDLAYTLQVGREAMEERLALQVSSLADLEEKLARYFCDLAQEGGDWYRGQVKQYKEMVALLSVDEELQEVTGKWLQRGKYEKLLQWWVKGGTIDWRLLYGEHLPRRISLPTYPFARERYWVPTPKSG
jgi:polyketide synthase PksN